MVSKYKIPGQLEKYFIYQIDFTFLRHLSAIFWMVMSNIRSTTAPKHWRWTNVQCEHMYMLGARDRSLCQNHLTFFFNGLGFHDDSLSQSTFSQRPSPEPSDLFNEELPGETSKGLRRKGQGKERSQITAWRFRHSLRPWGTLESKQHLKYVCFPIQWGNSIAHGQSSENHTEKLRDRLIDQVKEMQENLSRIPNYLLHYLIMVIISVVVTKH